MAAATTRQVVSSRLAESVGHIARSAALVALDPQIFGLKRRSTFEEAKRSFAAGRPVVDEVVPRKIVQMAVPAGQQEAGRNRVGISGGLIAFRAFAVLVHESRPFRTKPVFLAFEEAEIVRGQEPAFDAAQPAGKRPDRYADIRFRGEGIDAVVLLERRHAQAFDLRPQLPAHRRKQSRLFDRLTAIHLPSVDGECHDRQVGQVDQSARTVSPEELAGPHFADRSLFADHASPPLSSGVTTGGVQSGSLPPNLMVLMIRLTPGSTSRMDIGTVKLSHA